MELSPVARVVLTIVKYVVTFLLGGGAAYTML